MICSGLPFWKNADPELRQRMRGDFTVLVNEMTV